MSETNVHETTSERNDIVQEIDANSAKYVTVRGYVQDGVFHLDWTDNEVIGGAGFTVPVDELRNAVPSSVWGDVDELSTPCLENHEEGFFRVTYSAYAKGDKLLQRMLVSIEMEIEEMLAGFQIG